ncbi:hypothetical protein ACJX0J_037151, partial [Zea mays]
MATVIVQEGITIFVIWPLSNQLKTFLMRQWIFLFGDEVIHFLFLYITRTYEAALHLSNLMIYTLSEG